MQLTKQLSLRLKFFWGSLFYLSYAPKALRYSRWKEKVERQFPTLPVAETFAHPGKLLRAEAIENGAQFYFEAAELEVYFLAADLVRLTWRPGLLPVPYGIARHEWEPVATQLQETAQGWRIASQANGIKVTVAEDGGVIFQDANDALLRRDLPPAKPGDGWTHRAELQPDEAVYGLGERSVPLNLRLAREVTEKGEVTDAAKTFRMWNYDAAGKYDAGADPMYICIPLYMGLHSQGSYLIFYENSFDAQIQFTDITTAAFTGVTM
jgi:alpha-glucosidase